MQKNDTITLNGKAVPCKDVLQITPVMVSDKLFSEFTYHAFEPVYHEMKVLVPRKKAYALELKVRRYMCK